MKNEYIIGIDIGGTHFRIGLVSPDIEISNFQIFNSEILTVNGHPILNMIEIIREYINKYVKKKLFAISIGFPSTISKDKKKVYSTPNLNGFDNLDIVEPLYEVFKVPIILNKDVNNLLIWDIYNMNIDVKDKIVLGFYIGTGFGNSICIDGKLLEGKNGVAGELGHIPVVGKQDICGCGNKGCIEIYASGKKLTEINEKYFPETDIKEIFVKHKDEDIIKEYIETLAIPIATEINIFDPDYIIIGGGVIQLPEFPYTYFERCIKNHVRKPLPADNLSIIYSHHNQDAGIKGAAIYAYKKLGKESKLV